MNIFGTEGELMNIFDKSPGFSEGAHEHLRSDAHEGAQTATHRAQGRQLDLFTPPAEQLRAARLARVAALAQSPRLTTASHMFTEQAAAEADRRCREASADDPSPVPFASRS